MMQPATRHSPLTSTATRRHNTERDMIDNNHDLTIRELDAVSGGIKGAIEGVCRKDEGGQSGQSGQSDQVYHIAELFQQVLQQHI
jgi:hypothetical protein